MSAAYGAPIGGALFALEVLRGVLALRLILPALLACIIAAGISWLVRSFILPLVLAVVTATIVARTLDPRSIYDARFSNREIQDLQKARKPAPV
jgi:H+/Cl- antiporter ClcA